MAKKEKSSPRYPIAADQLLRQTAEVRLAHPSSVNSPQPSVAEVLHELQVHQIELEMQNDELRRTQCLLEEARDRYVDFYDFAPSGYITLTSEALITDINLAGASMLGLERRKLINRSLLPFIDQGCRDTWHRHFRSITQQDAKQSCELTILRGDGSRLSVQFDSLRLVKNEGAAMIRVALTDISELKRMENALQGSELKRHVLEQKEIVQTSLDGFWMVRTADGKILETNDTYCKMVGYSLEEIMGMSIGDLDATETPEETLAHLKLVRERGYDRFETQHRHKSGHLIAFEVSASRSEAHGGVNFAFFRDITERKHLEDSLKQSRAQLLAFVQQAPICIAMLDRDMNYLAVSGHWLEKYGRGNADLIGLNHYRVYSDMPSSWKTAHEQALAGSALGKKEDLLWMGDGQRHWLDWAVLPWKDENAMIGGIILYVEDITERKVLEQEVQAQRKQLEHLQKIQVAAQTAAAIAHEVNQPLVAITSYFEAARLLMQAKDPDLGKILKAIEGGEQQALRAGKSIRELLDFLGRKEYPVEDLSLNDEILNALNIASAEHERRFKTELRLEGALPPVRANRIHVQKVLLNLIHNGIDAMQEAGVAAAAITVTVCTSKNEDFAQVTVQDNGPGIKRQDRHRLFEPFFTTKANGIGMGLSISRSLIEENGGQLWVDTQEGDGAAFHFTLPFAK